MENAITQPEVWNNAEHRQMAIDVLLCTGTIMILRREDKDGYGLAWQFGLSIMLLDCHDEKGDFMNAFYGAQVKKPVFVNACGNR